MPLLLSLLLFSAILYYKVVTHWLYIFFGNDLFLKLALEIALHPELYMSQLILVGTGIVALALLISIIKKHLKIRVI